MGTSRIIKIGGDTETDSQGGSMYFSREGVYSYNFVYGDNDLIETSIVDRRVSESISNDTLWLEENWDTTVDWDLVEAKTKNTKYKDHYRRYTVDPVDTSLKAIDNAVTTGLPNAPAGYRKFSETLVKLPTDTKTTPSAYGLVETVTGTWVKPGDVGLTSDIDNEANLPSIIFNAKNPDVVDTTKDYHKFATISILGFVHVYKDSFVTGSNIETDFTPFLTMTKRRFQNTYVRNSYRDSPEETPIEDETGKDDTAAITQYAENQNDTLGRISTGGSVVLIGNSIIKNGDTISDFEIYYDGAYVTKPVDLLVVSRSYNVINDTTSITFGRP